MLDVASCVASVMAAQLVALVFLFASISKLFDWSAAVQAIEPYRLLPRRLARLIGPVLPWIELATAASLLSGILGGFAVAVAMSLLIIFSLAQGIVLLRGHEVPCGCFGSLSSRPVRWTNVIANLAFAACCLVGAQAFGGFFSSRWIGYAPQSASGSLSSTAEVVSLQLLTVTLFLQFLVLRQVMENRQHDSDYLRYQRELQAATAIQTITASSRPRGRGKAARHLRIVNGVVPVH